MALTSFSGGSVSGAKEELTRIIAEQPEDSTQEELVRELALRLMVRRGLDDADAGRTLHRPSIVACHKLFAVLDSGAALDRVARTRAGPRSAGEERERGLPRNGGRAGRGWRAGDRCTDAIQGSRTTPSARRRSMRAGA